VETASYSKADHEIAKEGNVIRIILITLSLLAFASPLHAQADRFDLGQRMRAMERELAKNLGKKAQKRAMEPLKAATTTFFKIYLPNRLPEASRQLDLARLALASEKKPTPLALWAASLTTRPSGRLVDPKSSKLHLVVQQSYPLKTAFPKEFKVAHEIQWVNAEGKFGHSSRANAKLLPHSMEFQFIEISDGDLILQSSFEVNGESFPAAPQIISVVSNLGPRLKKLREVAKGLNKEKQTTEKATLASLSNFLSDLAAGKTLETNIPAHRLLADAEQIQIAIKEERAFYGPGKTGQHWLSLVVGESVAPVRVLVPQAAKKGKPLPVVVALHGAGGSENMFFDGYGDGLIAKLCEKRGWYLIAPRGGLKVGILEEFGRHFPIDKKKIFLVGHSMGAAQAVAAASREPDKYAAVAALGGGGGFKDSDEIKKVPFFIGVGKEDFARGPAKSLSSALKKAGVKKVTLREYDDVEHLIIVQLALPDVFKFFDATGPR
jgi:pimeloyl-ACP methyl ester carboxylesterase